MPPGYNITAKYEDSTTILWLTLRQLWCVLCLNFVQPGAFDLWPFDLKMLLWATFSICDIDNTASLQDRLIICSSLQARFYFGHMGNCPQTSTCPLSKYCVLRTQNISIMWPKRSVLWPSNTSKCVSGQGSTPNSVGSLRLPQPPNRLGRGYLSPYPTILSASILPPSALATRSVGFRGKLPPVPLETRLYHWDQEWNKIKSSHLLPSI